MQALRLLLTFSVAITYILAGENAWDNEGLSDTLVILVRLAATGV
jgi:hypothetical protein